MRKPFFITLGGICLAFAISDIVTENYVMAVVMLVCVVVNVVNATMERG